MEWLVTYIRTLTLKETIEAPTQEEAEKLAEIRYGQLDNNEFQVEGTIVMEGESNGTTV